MSGPEIGIWVFWCEKCQKNPDRVETGWTRTKMLVRVYCHGEHTDLVSRRDAFTALKIKRIPLFEKNEEANLISTPEIKQIEG